MPRKNEGKIFEEDIEVSCKKLKIFFSRNRDVYIPPKYRNEIRVPKNKYDNLMFASGYQFALELKSTKQKSFSFSESIIKKHQIDNLLEASTYKDVIAGFIFNFRSNDNRTFFVHINDFLEYKNIAENNIKNHMYKSKINKSSIPFSICEEIGIEIGNKKKRTRYLYFIDTFISEIVNNQKNKESQEGDC